MKNWKEIVYLIFFKVLMGVYRISCFIQVPRPFKPPGPQIPPRLETLPKTDPVADRRILFHHVVQPT